MPAITIHLPADLYRRLLSLQVDPERFCLTAVETAIRGHMNEKSSDEPKAGRPQKRAGRAQVTVQLEQDLLSKLDAAAGGPWSRSDIINWLLEKWAVAGSKLPGTK